MYAGAKIDTQRITPAQTATGDILLSFTGNLRRFRVLHLSCRFLSFFVWFHIFVVNEICRAVDHEHVNTKADPMHEHLKEGMMVLHKE